MTLKSLDGPTTLESTDVTLGTRHLDLEMIDGFGSMDIIIPTTARTLVLADVLHSYVAPECGHHIDAQPVIVTSLSSNYNAEAHWN